MVQSGFRVALVAREFVGGDAGIGGEDLSEGEKVQILLNGSGDAGKKASGAEVVAMSEVGGVAFVLSDQGTAEVSVVRDPRARLLLANGVARKIVKVVGHGAADGLLGATSIRAVKIARGGGGARALSAIDLDEAIFSIIKIVVDAVCGHVAGSVVPGMIVREGARWNSEGRGGNGGNGGNGAVRWRAGIHRRKRRRSNRGRELMELMELMELEEFLAKGEVRSKVSASGTGAGDLSVSDAVRGGSLVGRPIIPMG